MIKTFIFLILFAHAAYAEEVNSRLKLKVQMDMGITHISTESKVSATAAESSTDFNQLEFRPTVFYYPSEKFAFGLYYFQTSFIEDYNTSGFGAAVKWHYLNRGTISDSVIDNKKITMTPTFSPYIDAGFKRQSFEGETIVIKYSGIEVGLGADWHMKNNYYVNMCLQFSSLSSGSSRTAVGQSFLVGLGRAI